MPNIGCLCVVRVRRYLHGGFFLREKSVAEICADFCCGYHFLCGGFFCLTGRGLVTFNGANLCPVSAPLNGRDSH